MPNTFDRSNVSLYVYNSSKGIIDIYRKVNIQKITHYGNDGKTDRYSARGSSILNASGLNGLEVAKDPGEIRHTITTVRKGFNRTEEESLYLVWFEHGDDSLAKKLIKDAVIADCTEKSNNLHAQLNAVREEYERVLKGLKDAGASR